MTNKIYFYSMAAANIYILILIKILLKCLLLTYNNLIICVF